MTLFGAVLGGGAAGARGGTTAAAARPASSPSSWPGSWAPGVERTRLARARGRVDARRCKRAGTMLCAGRRAFRADVSVRVCGSRKGGQREAAARRHGGPAARRRSRMGWPPFESHAAVASMAIQISRGASAARRRPPVLAAKRAAPTCGDTRVSTTARRRASDLETGRRPRPRPAVRRDVGRVVGGQSDLRSWARVAFAGRRDAPRRGRQPVTVTAAARSLVTVAAGYQSRRLHSPAPRHATTPVAPK